MPSHHDDEDVHYSEKVGTAEQQRNATRTYTYKSYWRGGKDDESKIYIQVRNVSWSSIRASLVKELIGVIYDEDEARPEADKENWFSHKNTSLTIKWTVDQRNNIAQLYTYDIDGERRPKGRDHPRGTWMQYNTLLGSGYVFNKTRNSNVRGDILNKARELFVHKRPHSKTMEGDWTCVEENGKYKLDERKNLDDWAKAKAENDLPWVARTEIIKTIKSGFTLPYKFRNFNFQVLNDCKVNLDEVTLDKLFRDYFSFRPIGPQAKKWAYWRMTEEESSTGRTYFSISKYHPSDYTSSNKKVWILNNTTNQSYQEVQGKLETTSEFQRNAQNESHWKLGWREEEGAEKGRLTVEKISNDESKEQERSRSRSRSRSHSQSHSRHKRPESESGNGSSSSTVSDGDSEVGKIRSQKPIPSPLFGYTHSLAKSPNSTKIWSGRPESNNSSLIGIHGINQSVQYYGHELINDTSLSLWWDEIADILLSENIIIPISAKEPKKQGTLTEQDGNLVIEIDPYSGNPGAGMKSFVSSLSNLCDAPLGTPKDSCTHKRCRIKTYPLPKSKDSGLRRYYPSVSIRNRLSDKVAYISILRGLRELVNKPGDHVFLAQNKGEIWELVEKSDGNYLSKPNSTPLRITIVPLAKKRKDTSSKTVYHSCYESQRDIIPRSHSTHRLSPSVSSSDSSNQPRSARSLALSEYERYTDKHPDYIRSRKHGARSLDSRSSAESSAGNQFVSFAQLQPTDGRTSTSSISAKKKKSENWNYGHGQTSQERANRKNTQEEAREGEEVAQGKGGKGQEGR
ncbi:hypothetical protein BOTCAL_0310g00070 [Botryotinia calthae]|uniref:Uncharacterized protein n=1 Tax=Botryotinia calthae TaxID=38488 RepID=A0A4Y8CWQ8_9HELO|nr:hypothetical protein BOTCAL_0310g00070 [Botryotinia calthae]